jgi:hypothetical protein
VCGPCAEARAEAGLRDRLRDLVIESGLPPRYAGFTFERHAKQTRGEDWGSFRDRLDALSSPDPVLGVTGWNVAAAQAVRDWRPFGTERRPPRVIYLTGPVGSGKTTLAAASAMASLRELARRREACEAGADRFRVVWASVAEVWEAIRQETAAKSTTRGTIAKLAGADVLYLDDLGALESVRPWHRDALEYVICARYDRDRPTLITSNLRLDSEASDEPTIAAQFGERVVSRLVEGLGGRRRGRAPGYLELFGWDWRADVPHPNPDPARPASPSAGPSTPGPSAAVARPVQLPMDWRSRQAADRDD